jgi:hypothetical protein
MMIEAGYVNAEKFVSDKVGIDWDNIRKRMLTYSKNIKEIYLSSGNAETDYNVIMDTIRSEMDNYSATKLKDELELYFEIAGNVEIVFLFDEASEAINQKKFNLLDLEGISEAFSSVNGRVWTMAIAQEKLDDVINNSNISKSNLTKMTDRFKSKIHIEATEVGVIIQNRLLNKTDQGKELLEENFAKNSGAIEDTAMLYGTGLSKTNDKSNYAVYFPFYKYQFELMQNFLFGKKGYSSTNVAARGMIISAYDILKKELQDEELFSTANAWQITKQAQPQPPALLVNRYESAERALKEKGSLLSGRNLLETVHFLEDAGSAPSTLSNVVKSFISSPEEYFKVESEIKDALSTLTEAKILIFSDNFYRITSDIEQRLLDEMNEYDLAGYVRKNDLIERYKSTSVMKQVAKIVDNGIGYDFYITSDNGDEITTPSRKNVKLMVKSLYNISDDRNGDISVIKNDYQNQKDILWLIPDNSQFTEIDKLIREIRKIEYIAEKYQKPNAEETPFVRTFLSIKDTKVDNLKSLIEKAMKNSTLVYLYNTYLLNEDNYLGILQEQERNVIKNVYTKRLSTQLNENIAAKVIKEANATKLQSYFSGSDFEFFDVNGNLIGEKLRVAEEVFSIIKNTFVEGATIESKLAEPPTGYNYGTVVSTLAALMRGGRIIAKFNGSEKFSYRDENVDTIFTNATNFRKTSYKAITKSLSAVQKNEIVSVLKNYEAVDRNGKKIDWNTNDFDLVSAISKTAESYYAEIKTMRNTNKYFDEFYPNMCEKEKILAGFVSNINDQNYIDKAEYFINNKDVYAETIEQIEECREFIRAKERSILTWQLFIKDVKDDIAKSAKTIPLISSDADEFEVLMIGGITTKYSKLQSLFQKIKDEYYKLFSDAANIMTFKYKKLKKEAENVIEKINVLPDGLNVVAKSKTQSVLRFAENRICEKIDITDSIKENTTKLTYSEVLSANDMYVQKEMELQTIEAQLIKTAPASIADDITPVNESQKKAIIITRIVPSEEITINQYKVWLMNELKAIAGMNGTDIIKF